MLNQGLNLGALANVKSLARDTSAVVEASPAPELVRRQRRQAPALGPLAFEDVEIFVEEKQPAIPFEASMHKDVNVPMSPPALDFDIELLVERLQAHVGALVREHHTILRAAHQQNRDANVDNSSNLQGCL